MEERGSEREGGGRGVEVTSLQAESPVKGPR